MFKRTITTAIVAVSLPFAAGAATQTFTDQAAFLAAIGGVPTTTETFDISDQLLSGTGTVFNTGVTVTPFAASADNRVQDEVLRLSVDNDSGNATNPANPLTSLIEIMLPNASRFFGIDFGSTSGSGGIGNNSGTMLDDNLAFNFSTLSPGQTTSGYSGFFGLIADDAFTKISFSSEGIGNFTDDDFRADNLVFEAVAPIPVPAGLPLLLGGMAVFGALRARRKTA